MEGVIALLIPLLIPIAFFVGLFSYLILKQRYRKEIYLAAIERGASVPDLAEASSDLRKPALVLIALGLGFSIATHVTLSYVNAPFAPIAPNPWQTSIWGLVPILIGLALLTYKHLADKDRGSASEPPS